MAQLSICAHGLAEFSALGTAGSVHLGQQQRWRHARCWEHRPRLRAVRRSALPGELAQAPPLISPCARLSVPRLLGCTCTIRKLSLPEWMIIWYGAEPPQGGSFDHSEVLCLSSKYIYKLEKKKAKETPKCCSWGLTNRTVQPVTRKTVSSIRILIPVGGALTQTSVFVLKFFQA